MADDDHRHGLAGQVAFEPFGRGDIEMVRRFVQEHQVGAFEQELGEHQPRLLAAGKRRRLAGETPAATKPRPVSTSSTR